eukprot:2202843-Lingulodinium_polyedra.AAC.1
MVRRGFACAGQELEKVVGHLIRILALRREFLCLLHAVYQFIQRSYLRRQPLWSSARKELAAVLALLPKVVARMGMPWHDE